MATAVKKLDLEIGELIEVAGRRYEAVPDREGGLILERYAPNASARLRAESARKEIEVGGARLAWRPCEAKGVTVRGAPTSAYTAATPK